MLQDLALLDPRSFHDIENGLPQNALEKLAGALKALNPDITQTSLQEELLDLARQWKLIKFGRLDEYSYYNHQLKDEDSEREDEQEEAANANVRTEIITS